MVNDWDHRDPSGSTAFFRYTAAMLFMVIERFRQGDPKAVGERFQTQGRMLPEGVAYQASWMDLSGTRCYQLMEAASAHALSQWTRNWDDLVEFEIVPVLSSADYWARTARQAARQELAPRAWACPSQCGH